MNFVKPLLTAFLLLSLNGIVNASEQRFVLDLNGSDYSYVVKETGVNYHFEFDHAIVDENLRKQAGLHVLKSVYHDASIKSDFSKTYSKERAECFALDSQFHTYTLCFLPNDFSKEHQQRFWGFVTRVPNWTWQLTYVLLPSVLAALLGFYWLGSRKKNK